MDKKLAGISNFNSNVEWKPVKGYEGIYDISNTGLVRSLERTVPHLNRTIKIGFKILTTRINNSGYLGVRLSKNGKTTTKFIHILLAEIFSPNLLNKNEVNHKNGIKLDNSIENLEWVTHSENMQHAYKTGLCKTINRQISVVDNCLDITFPSVKKAAEFCNIPYSTFKSYLNGNRKNTTCMKYAKDVAA